MSPSPMTESKPRYIYSVGDAILSADVTIDDRIPRLTNERRVTDKMNTVQALGFHYERHLLYFSDTVRDVIYRGDPDVGKWTEHTVGTRQVEGGWLLGACWSYQVNEVLVTTKRYLVCCVMLMASDYSHIDKVAIEIFGQMQCPELCFSR